MPSKFRPPENSAAPQEGNGRLRRRLAALLVLAAVVAIFAITHQAVLRDMEQSGAVIPAPVEEVFDAKSSAESQSSAAPEKTAEETVLDAIGKLRSTQDPTSIFDDIDWAAAFTLLSPSQRSNLAIRTPAGMAQYYEEHFSSPNAFFVREMAKRIQNFPPDKQREITDFIKEQRASSPPAQKIPALAETLFELGKISEHDGVATVEIKSNFHGKISETTAQLRKKRGKWLFQCVYLIEDPLNLCE